MSLTGLNGLLFDANVMCFLLRRNCISMY
jgi:hypothetical protein